MVGQRTIARSFNTMQLVFHYVMNPFDFITVLGNTIANPETVRFYRQSFIGVLGWLDTKFDGSFYRACGWMIRRSSS